MNECNRRGRERFLHIVTCLENLNPYIMDYTQKYFPLTSALCAGHTQPLWVSTQNTAGRILASFVKCLKFEFFGLRVLATWTESPLLSLLWMKESFQIPNAGCSSGSADRQSCSCTFHPLFQPFYFSCSFIYSQEKTTHISLRFLRIPFEIKLFLKVQFQPEKDVFCYRYFKCP